MKAKSKTIILIPITLLTLCGLTFFIFQAIKTRTELAETKQLIIADKGEHIMDYFENIDLHNEYYQPTSEQTDQTAKQISFATALISDEQSKTIIPFSEVAKTISENFTDADYTDEDLAHACPSIILHLNNVICDEIKHEFTVSKTTDPRTVAATPIIKYIQQESSGKSSEYSAIYARYEFANPYDILNFAADTEDSLTPQIKSYLDGTGSLAPVKDAITQKLADKYGEKTGEITVFFSVEDGKFRVKEYREN